MGLREKHFNSKKILLFVPNYAWGGRRTWKVLPFTIPILGAILKKYDFDIIDCNINHYSENDVERILLANDAEIIMIATISAAYATTCHKLAAVIKQAKPNCLLIMGGVYVTTCVEHVMEDNNIDIGWIGHAEDRLEPFTDNILEEKWDEIKNAEGIAYRDEFGKVIINPLLQEVADAKSVKPDYSKTDIIKYVNSTEPLTSITSESNKKFSDILTSYGCPYNCIFCASRTISGKRVVTRPADDVLDEIDFLVNECGIELLNVMDDNILYDKDRAHYIFEQIVERNYGIEIRIDNVAIWHLDRDILSLMKKANVTRLGISVESGCERVLHKIIRKPLKLDIVKPIREMCRDVDILMTANFMIGLPGETWDELRESLRFAEECDFDYIVINIATPMPKTDLYTYAIEYGALDKNYSFYDESHFANGVAYMKTDDWTPQELQIIRAYEWDRINFSTQDKRERACRVLELSLEDLKEFRQQTRLSVGKYARKM